MSPPVSSGRSADARGPGYVKGGPFLPGWPGTWSAMIFGPAHSPSRGVGHDACHPIGEARRQQMPVEADYVRCDAPSGRRLVQRRTYAPSRRWCAARFACQNRGGPRAFGHPEIAQEACSGPSAPSTLEPLIAVGVVGGTEVVPGRNSGTQVRRRSRHRAAAP